MKNGVELIASQLIAIKNQSANPPSQPQKPINTVDQLKATRRILYFFERLQSLYGRRYQATFNTPEQEAQAKKEWSPYIQTLSKAMMDRGFELAKQKNIEGDKQYQWPNIPDIIRLCKPSLEQLGLSSAEAAFTEACQHAHEPTQHPWSHQAVYLAGQQVGWYTLRCDSHLDSVRKQFAQDYQQLCNRLLAGESIEAGVRLALPNYNQITAEQQTLADQHKLMVQQGINPKGGRAEFLKNWRQLSR